MKSEEKTNSKNYDKLIKILQILAGVFMLGMIVLFVILMKKYDISVTNAEALTQRLQGGIVSVALILIAFNLAKSFALIVTPSIVFVVSGVIFDSVWVAIAVNFIATAIGLIPVYFLGKFTGKPMVDTLSRRFDKVKKIDDFAGQNGFVISLVVKASGLIPGDLTSLLLGAMDIPFGRYYLGSTLGTLPLNILWAVLGSKGDFSNPYTLLYLLPIIAFVIIMSFVVKKVTSKSKTGKTESAE